MSNTKVGVTEKV